MALRNHKLKQDIAIHLLEWPKSRALRIPSADENMELQELSLVAGGDAKGDSPFGRQFGSLLQN